MRIFKPESEQRRLILTRSTRLRLPAIILACCSASCLLAQTSQPADQDSVPQQIQKLTEAMAKAQNQIEESQHQLDEMRQQLAALQRQMAVAGANRTPPTQTSPRPDSSAHITTAAPSA